jgi:hypothetical protein
MENTTWSWARKGVVALFALLVAGSCMLLAGCAENSEEAVRNAVTNELDEIKNFDAEEIEELANESTEFAALSAYGITATDAYEAIFSDFDYSIEDVKVDGDKATVGIKFTTKDLNKFQSALVSAAQQADADGSLEGLTQSEMNAKIGELVLNTIKDLPTTETKVIDFDVVKQGGSWQMANDSGEVLQEALFPSSVMSSN